MRCRSPRSKGSTYVELKSSKIWTRLLDSGLKPCSLTLEIGLLLLLGQLAWLRQVSLTNFYLHASRLPWACFYYLCSVRQIV